MKTVNFLDITFDLQSNVYKPYRKANDKPTYVNKSSNHPLSILKQLTESIEKRFSETASSKDIFDKSLKLYQDALKDSGYSNDFRYVENNNNTNDSKRNRKRKIIWFNSPFFKSVKTNIGKIFLQLLSKHFPKNHKMHKIFNRNTVKISYSCMKNIDSIISAHNRNILNSIVQSSGCNCRVKSSYPLNGECLTPKIINRANVSNDENSKRKCYFGLADKPFKERYRNHTRDFKHEKYENCTEFAKYIWQLKRSNIDFSIEHSIASKVSGNPSSVICPLCITEKLWIIKFLNKDLLNKKSELTNKCRHLNKFLLAKVKNR